MRFEFKKEKNSFATVFYRNTKEIIQEGAGEKTSQKTSQKILKLMKANNHITINELSAELEISERAVKYQIASLKEKGVIERIGHDRSGYWKIKGI